MKRYDITTTPFNSLLDTFFADLPATTPKFFSTAARDWSHFRVRELEKGFSVEAELAGVKKDDLKIEVLGDTLKVSGFRGSKEATEDGTLEYSEFSKSFTLGKDVDTENIEAKFENGYLSLLIPRAENKKTRIIDVK